MPKVTQGKVVISVANTWFLQVCPFSLAAMDKQVDIRAFNAQEISLILPHTHNLVFSTWKGPLGNALVTDIELTDTPGCVY